MAAYTSAGSASTGEPGGELLFRDDLLAESSSVGGAGAAPVTLLVGESGAGSSAVLTAVGERLRSSGCRLVRLTAAKQDRRTAYGALYRLLSEIDRTAPPDQERAALLGLVAKLGRGASPESLRAAVEQVAVLIRNVVRHLLPVAVLVDEAQWLDHGTASVLEPLVRRLAGARFSLVLTARADPDSAVLEPVWNRLSTQGLLRTLPVRTFTKWQSGQFLAKAIVAKPDVHLVDELHRLSGGRPAMLLAAVDAHRRAGALVIADHNAYLRRSLGAELPVDGSRLLAPLRKAGDVPWAVAKAMSLLAPLGPQAVDLIAEAGGLSADAVHDALATLVKHRFLTRRGSGWRFRVPLIATALERALGPYEHRKLAAAAVTAIWSGTAHSEDPTYLPNRMTAAGSLVDTRRSGEELMKHAGTWLLDPDVDAARWLRAVAERVDDPALRTEALRMHITASIVRDDLPELLRTSRTLVRHHAHELSPQILPGIVLAYLMVLAAMDERVELGRIAEGEQPVPGGTGQQLVARAFASGWMGNWVEGRRLLDGNAAEFADEEPVLVQQAEIYRTGAAVMQGDNADLFRFVAEFAASPHESENLTQWAEAARHQVNLLLAIGEVREARQLMHRCGLPEHLLTLPDRFLLDHSRGEWRSAMDIARRCMSSPIHTVRPFGWATMHAIAAQVHIDSGMLGRARQLIEIGKDGPFGYMFHFTESLVRHALGELRASHEHLRAAVRGADAAEFLFGTEVVLAELAHRAKVLGETDEAATALNRLEKLATRLGTGRAELAMLLTRARLGSDESAACAAVALAREREEPYEMAVTFSKLASGGYRPVELLPEAYRLTGGLDALLLRARLRHVMRQNGVPVPDRSATTSENERLLAVLVAEGLTNRQLATVFATTEKSVEGRLTRMFARIGYRSRVELAAAMLTGDFGG
ncbi:AAA family ATPase [Saccharopolyspora sp. NFXS83]|uniref:AAA family ATPase n=1 Tax=Saccharopolyspora sp. NFXS83 TaxID=2993560 RepID=UPI00224AEA5A|nr:AAA family ATPase [Saccharopolyspora sp. NFXS83]MCX2731490.1 AAA family ATPase [Saccharopolyspora sp. NFXS83]